MLKLKCKVDLIECGTDEAGRGCLAGPVTAAAVILKDDFKNEILNDSKQLSEKNRNSLRSLIEKESLCFGVTHVMMEEIDEINILNASILGMHRSIEKLQTSPEHIAVDGNKFKPLGDIPYECVIKGDGKFLNIAAASILAKTYRDEFMAKIHEEFPMYNWKKNKGYPTREHREAIQKYGITKYHRKSFRLLPDQLSLEL
ncbi:MULTISPECIES: ribonuclease HII [Mesonia]|uniref:Ribonuclease HII n=1 Tax=Mesonia oceanica TaxID=2687242 RepID=A0AC61YE11_9FLAO|nr:MULTISPECIES: ribonuclease HII [Mesonia]MAN26445.1 ribonuclease HII [Mesonia sp.]MAQ39585.1 ribonuclease HII [Mesonia sp.]MBJ99174.1 ribonuclease HII [Flavobacteriaceae bacterium]VVV02393.1 Ribonuclease HII [Mesonia oceanica]|tara:strand:- start:4666 stop:5265 length:600 start_codon:yes stop_codon:yes gene_type:complete